MWVMSTKEYQWREIFTSKESSYLCDGLTNLFHWIFLYFSVIFAFYIPHIGFSFVPVHVHVCFCLFMYARPPCDLEILHN